MKPLFELRCVSSAIRARAVSRHDSWQRENAQTLPLAEFVCCCLCCLLLLVQILKGLGDVFGTHNSSTTRTRRRPNNHLVRGRARKLPSKSLLFFDVCHSCPKPDGKQDDNPRLTMCLNTTPRPKLAPASDLGVRKSEHCRMGCLRLSAVFILPQAILNHDQHSRVGVWYGSRGLLQEPNLYTC